MANAEKAKMRRAVLLLHVFFGSLMTLLKSVHHWDFLYRLGKLFRYHRSTHSYMYIFFGPKLVFWSSKKPT